MLKQSGIITVRNIQKIGLLLQVYFLSIAKAMAYHHL